MTPALETARLLLRPLSLEDAEQLQRVFPRWENVRLLAGKVPWPYPADGALTFVRDIALPAMEAGRGWHWTLRRKEAPEVIVGGINLNAGESENRGFWVAPEWRGLGYATEACAAVTAFWFDVLGQPALRVYKAAANEASRRISIREGMRLVGTTERDFVSGRAPAELWEITAEEWRARRGR